MVRRETALWVITRRASRLPVRGRTSVRLSAGAEVSEALSEAGPRAALRPAAALRAVALRAVALQLEVGPRGAVREERAEAAVPAEREGPELRLRFRCVNSTTLTSGKRRS